MFIPMKNLTDCKYSWYLVLIAVLCLTAYPAFAQEAVDNQEVTEPVPLEDSADYWDWEEGELIELDAVQIEGEIAQPNVTITVSRQEPMFRQIGLERTPVEGLIDLDIREQGIKALEVVRIENWGEILDRPRE
ncbi:hypothetical protein CEE37_00560 [candidate division LCP-89 bacterium B3_LCP]|uniref:Uncharacterized protein n=1 Tax=candidate division LCP-89 bacterium B3_LCP TaxID=2012998 RepID=A0A532V4Y6_UNCL8|nr:MAG: hypothetical protein CEE37_00560 [candidate division LCP-89 bacterium B3_LCP]